MSSVMLPALIDPHVHLRDPGQTHKEDFSTGTSAALAGGYATILDMPNNKIPITTLDRLKEKIEIAKKKIVCDVGFFFGSLGDNLDEFEKVKDLVFGLKLYLNETTGNFLIDKKTLVRIFDAWEGGPILVHAEDKAVAEVIENVKRTKKRTHFCHISTAQDLKQIISAKENQLPISCGVTPHHLFLTEQDGVKLGPFGKMKPPLRSKKNVEFLWKNLKYIDCIESDHAPHTVIEKQSSNPPYGVPELETTLVLLVTAANENRLTIDDIVRLCHTNPARIFGIRNDLNTMIEVDLNEEYTIDRKTLKTKCNWTPFEKWRVKGKVKRVFLRGKKVFEDGIIVVKPGFGRFIAPNF